MKSQSPLDIVHEKGLNGDYEGKNESDILKINEVKNLLIVQIVKFKDSKITISNFKINGIEMSEESNMVKSINETRILWVGPNNWLVTSTDKNLLPKIKETFKETDFAVTDLSHSRAIIEIEGKNCKEVLKKGCPYNFNLLNKNNSINSTYNGIAFTVDMINDDPIRIRLFALRSFGESLYHSITDSCLEFGYKAI